MCDEIVDERRRQNRHVKGFTRVDFPLERRRRAEFSGEAETRCHFHLRLHGLDGRSHTVGAQQAEWGGFGNWLLDARARASGEQQRDGCQVT